MDGYDYLNLEALAKQMGLSEAAVKALLRSAAADIVEPDISRDIERAPRQRRERIKSSASGLLNFQDGILKRAAQLAEEISDDEWERLINGE